MASDKPSLGILLSDNILRLIPILEQSFLDVGLAINCPQYRLLTYLAEDGPKILNDVADTFGKDKSMMLRYVDRLEELQFVTRSADPNDLRRKLLLLTTNGLSALKAAQKVEARLYNTLFRGIQPEDKNSFHATLIHIAKKIPAVSK